MKLEGDRVNRIKIIRNLLKYEKTPVKKIKRNNSTNKISVS